MELLDFHRRFSPPRERIWFVPDMRNSNSRLNFNMFRLSTLKFLPVLEKLATQLISKLAPVRTDASSLKAVDSEHNEFRRQSKDSWSPLLLLLNNYLLKRVSIFFSFTVVNSKYLKTWCLRHRVFDQPFIHICFSHFT